MPTIGWFEILIVVAIAIVVLGPKDFPVMLKKAGSWIGTAKRYVSNIQNEVSNLEIDDEKINETEENLKTGSFSMEDYLSQLRQMKKMGGMEGVLSMLPGVSKIKKQMAVSYTHLTLPTNREV